MYEKETKSEGDNSLFEHYPFQQQTPQMSAKDNLILQTTPERISEILEHRMRGEVWDDQNGKWILKREPVMNNAGIDWVISNLQPYLTQASTMSNITYKMAKDEAKAYGDALVDALSVNSKKWKLSKSLRTPLVVSLITLVYNVLTRSIGKVMSDKEMYATTISSQEHTMYKMGEDRKKSMGSVFTSLNPFRKSGGKY